MYKVKSCYIRCKKLATYLFMSITYRNRKNTNKILIIDPVIISQFHHSLSGD